MSKQDPDWQKKAVAFAQAHRPHPNPKDPQADIREKLMPILHRYKYPDQYLPVLHDYGAKQKKRMEIVDEAKAEILTLFQAREQQLLGELLAAAIPVEYEAKAGTARTTAVPVSVIERKIGELNG